MVLDCSYNNRYFRCKTKYVHTGSCVGAYITVNELENTIIEQINSLSEKYLDENEIKKSIIINNNYEVQKKN